MGCTTIGGLSWWRWWQLLLNWLLLLLRTCVSKLEEGLHNAARLGPSAHMPNMACIQGSLAFASPSKSAEGDRFARMAGSFSMRSLMASMTCVEAFPMRAMPRLNC